MCILEVGEDDTAPSHAALQSPPDMVLLIHAYRSGRPWLLSRAPADLKTAVLLSGTDLNQDLAIPERAAIINQTLAAAAGVLVQNSLTFSDLQSSALPWRSKLHLLPPGILLGTQTYPLRSQLGQDSDDLLLLHPASLRPVKGRIELLQMANGLLKRTPKIHLAFCGPLIDRDYAAQFLALLNLQARASYLGEIPCVAMPDVLRQSDLVLNNSLSEGVPNALVEAASLGRPILARNIPGNRSVVRNGINGLLFDAAPDFERQLRRLLAEPNLRPGLSRPDPQTSSAEAEGERLATILEELCPR